MRARKLHLFNDLLNIKVVIGFNRIILVRDLHLSGEDFWLFEISEKLVRPDALS